MNKHRSAHQTRRQRGLALPVLFMAAAVIAFGLLIYQAARPLPGHAIVDLGNEHITYPETATYNSTPPTSGAHYESLASWGIHSEPIPNELQVHNLEDGGVLVQYSCPDGCPTTVAQLSRIVEAYGSYVILAPYRNMDRYIALTAWGRMDALDEVDETRITKFIETYRGLDHHR